MLPAPPDWPVPTPQPLTPPPPAKTSASTPPTPFETEGQKALAYILKHVVLDPNAIVPGTGAALTSHGIWSIGKLRPTSCPKDTTPCTLILYRTPDSVVSCQWVVLLSPDAPGGGSILEQNADATRFLLRTIPTAEAAPYIVTRQPTTDGRQPLRSPGTAEVGVIVSTTGEPSQIITMSGPDPLRTAAYDMARQWTFRPLTVGTRTIPYQIILKFHFDGPTVKTEP
jgi:hypothetical protein